MLRLKIHNFTCLQNLNGIVIVRILRKAKRIGECSVAVFKVNMYFTFFLKM